MYIQRGLIFPTLVLLVLAWAAITYAATIEQVVCNEVMAIAAMDTSGQLTVAQCTEKCDALFTMALDSEEQMLDDYCNKACIQAISHGNHHCHH